jgi:hypothetical protein
MTIQRASRSVGGIVGSDRRGCRASFHLYWSDDNNRFDLSKRARLRSMYQIVLTEGSTADVVAFVNRELLLGVWDELWLSPAVDAAWDSWIQAHRVAGV